MNPCGEKHFVKGLFYIRNYILTPKPRLASSGQTLSGTGQSAWGRSPGSCPLAGAHAPHPPHTPWTPAAPPNMPPWSCALERLLSFPPRPPEGWLGQRFWGPAASYTGLEHILRAHTGLGWWGRERMYYMHEDAEQTRRARRWTYGLSRTGLLGEPGISLPQQHYL